MAKNYYLSGQWNVTCDVCSKKIKSSEAKHRWDGLIVCPACWEQRHPLDFIRSKAEYEKPIPYQRPIPASLYIAQNFAESLTNKVDINDLNVRVVTYIRNYTDTVSTTDNGITTAQGYGRSFSDTVVTSETFVPLLVTLLDLVDSVSITEAFVKSVSAPKTDSTVVLDNNTKESIKVVLDTLSISDVLNTVLIKTITDTVTLTETIAFTQVVNDAINDTAINVQTIN